MARSYGNSRIDQRTFSRKVERRRKLQAKAPPPRPIIDEENPIPDKYEGDIIFNKTIYSRNLFERNIDTDFNELNAAQSSVSVEEFFRLYNETFFNIPKEGENSHTTIVQTSLEFLNDYKNPLQDLVDAQAIELEAALLAAETAKSDLEALQALRIAEQEQAEAEAQEEAAQEEAAENNYLAFYGGSLSDPLLKADQLKANLNTGKFFSENRNSYKNNTKDDLQKVINNGPSERFASQWKSDINGVGGSSSKKKGDMKAMVDATVLSIASKAYGDPNNAWKV
tara:strand:+ start:2158 stop:3003 length:846 start_codon:yes stop_codon:yes gene_type:complete